MPDDITSLGGTILTELAQTFENHQSNLGQFFPSRNVPQSKVEIEKLYGGVGMAPPVDPGKPDSLSDDGLKAEKTTVEPVYSRESFLIPAHIVNTLRQPGTINETYGKKYVADMMKMYVGRSDLLSDFLRAQMLLGGVDYTDPRTGKHVQVSAGIPAGHIITTPPAKDWDAFDAKILDDIMGYKSLITDNGKVPPTHIIMTSARRDRIALSDQVLARAESPRDTGNVVFKDGVLTRVGGLEVVTQDTVYEALSAAAAPTATVTVSGVGDGKTLEIIAGGISSGAYIAGAGDTNAVVARNLVNFINGNPAMPVIATVAAAVVTLSPKEPLKNQSIEITTSGDMTGTVAGSPLVVSNSGLARTVTKMIPDNKVIIVCKEYVNEPLGRTDYVIGEHPDGRPGIWSRASDTTPPQAPGTLVQIGRAGLPYLRYPDWVVVATVKAA